MSKNDNVENDKRNNKNVRTLLASSSAAVSTGSAISAYDEEFKEKYKHKKERNIPLSFVFGALSGGVGTLATQPLDVIKTRLQASSKLQSIIESSEKKVFYRTFSNLSLIHQREGFKGLFRGLVPNLLGIMPSRAIYFATYEEARKLYQRRIKNHDILSMLSGATASLTCYTLLNPVWLIKTRIQLQEIGHTHQGGTNYGGYWNCFKTVYREEGIRGYYKGLLASYFGIAESSLYFLIYERMKKYNEQKHPLGYLLIASFSKMVASMATYPHEVVRTRMRELVNGKTPYNGVIDAFKTIYKRDGFKGYYVGMGTHLLKSIPNTAIMFFCYEYLMLYFA